MKKITLLLVFLFGAVVFCNAQVVTILTVDGMAPSAFSAENPTLLNGATYSLVVEYTDVTNDPSGQPRIQTRFLEGYDPIDGATTTSVVVTTSATVQTVTIDIIVPEAPYSNTGNTGRMLAFSGGGAGGARFSYVGTFNVVATLSTNDFNKLESSFYSTSKDAIVLNSNVVGNYKVYDLTGKTLIEGDLSEEISVSALESGVYILATKGGVLKFAK